MTGLDTANLIRRLMWDRTYRQLADRIEYRHFAGARSGTSSTQTSMDRQVMLVGVIAHVRENHHD
jgi:hypothetical protein